MAGIDNTFVSEIQFRQVLDWISDLRPDQKVKLPHIKCKLSDFNDSEACVLWKTNEEQDKWLVLNCKLDFIQERIIEQNGIEFKYKVLYEKCKQEAIEQLEECGLEWIDDFLIPQDYSPDFDYGQEEYYIWFNIILGKMIILKDLIENKL